MSFVSDQLREYFSQHVLVQVLDTEKFKAFYLKKPGDGRMYSCLITFTPEGIVIQGDITPSDSGNVSAFGYGLSWFGSRKSESYLCEKFLDRVFDPEWTRDACKERIIENRKEEQYSKKKARQLWSEIPDVDLGCEDPGPAFYAFITDDLGDDGDLMRYDYPKREAGLLCAIQQRFSELWQSAIGLKEGE